MNLVPVSSSTLKAVGYEQTGTMQVMFTNGEQYQYYGVPPSVHAELMAASSHATYFDAHIKQGSYRFWKLR